MTDVRPERVAAWAVLFASGMVVAGELLLGAGVPYRRASLEPFVLQNPADGWTHNQFELHRLRQPRKSGSARRVVILGGSASLEAVTSDAALSEAMASNGSPYDVVTLASAHKTLGDETKLAGELADVDGDVVIPIDILQLTKAPERQLEKKRKDGKSILYKYGGLVADDEVHAILEQHGGEVPLRHQFLLPRAGRQLGARLERLGRGALAQLRGRGTVRQSYERHAAGDMLAGDLATLQRNESWLPKALDDIESHGALNRDLLRFAVHRLLADGHRVVVVDLPTHPSLDHLITDAHRTRYDALVQTALEGTDARHLDLRTADLGPEHFNDFHHLTSAGRERFTPLYGRALRHALTDHGHPPGGAP